MNLRKREEWRHGKESYWVGICRPRYWFIFYDSDDYYLLYNMIRSSYDNFYVFTKSYYDSNLFWLIYFSYHSMHVDRWIDFLFFRKLNRRSWKERKVVQNQRRLKVSIKTKKSPCLFLKHGIKFFAEYPRTANSL